MAPSQKLMSYVFTYSHTQTTRTKTTNTGYQMTRYTFHILVMFMLTASYLVFIAYVQVYSNILIRRTGHQGVATRTVVY